MTEKQEQELIRFLDALEHAHGLTSTCGIQQCNCIDAQDWRDLKAHLTREWYSDSNGRVVSVGVQNR